MSAIEKAMRAVCVEYFGMDEDILTTELPHVVEIAKRELKKAAPADADRIMQLCEDVGLCGYGEDCGTYTIPATAFVARIVRLVTECRKQMGLE